LRSYEGVDERIKKCQYIKSEDIVKFDLFTIWVDVKVVSEKIVRIISLF
jgi:hypothetical protein